MRKEFSKYLLEKVKKQNDIVLLTGDLGFNALEELRDYLGDKFLNCGVAEQNMIGVAAGLASRGFKVFCYSIAPFVTFRVLEQIKIDCCLHNLPVCIVGNGGGYGYGIMGPTHHAIEDLTIICSLPNMTAYIPSFNNDVCSAIDSFLEYKSPSYLRLGYNSNNEKINLGLEQLKKSKEVKISIIALGPVVQNVIDIVEESECIDVFTINKIPFELTQELKTSLVLSKKLLVVEEHVRKGGIAEHIALRLMEEGIVLDCFKSLASEGYKNFRYGSQKYHQTINGLDSNNISKIVKAWI